MFKIMGLILILKCSKHMRYNRFRLYRIFYIYGNVYANSDVQISKIKGNDFIDLSYKFPICFKKKSSCKKLYFGLFYIKFKFILLKNHEI